VQQLFREESSDLTAEQAELKARFMLSRALAPVLGWLPSRPIEARTVALALARLAKTATPGVRVVKNDELHALAR
jgi:hypothetical protein